MENLSFKSWDQFRAFIDDDNQPLSVYWRGQRDPTWPLASSFERTILNMQGGWLDGASKIYPYDRRYKTSEGNPYWSEGYYRDMRDNYLHLFMRAAGGLRGNNPADLDIDQFWALGRHYGLVTPLLDWSEKPYVAAFFALTELFTEMKDKSGNLVWAGRKVAIYRLFHNQQLEGDGLRVVRPMIHELRRLQGQRSVFTWLDSEKYFELQGFLDNTSRGDLLTKIELSDQALRDGLRDLNKHGIDYRLYTQIYLVQQCTQIALLTSPN